MRKIKEIPEYISEIDNKLFSIVSDIDILAAIAPLNYREQKELFFENKGNVNPKFLYSKATFLPFQKKRELLNLPIEKIKSKQLHQLYSEIIQSYTDKLDQFRHIGDDEFLYDSLRYYGEPRAKEINNAQFILHVTAGRTTKVKGLVKVEDIKLFFEHFADANKYPLNLSIEDGMIANALVVQDKVSISSRAMLTNIEMKALAHHELGVHLATTLNAQAQPLKVLQLGSPVNTKAQEGLAILCEYLAGFLTLERLRTLALRVIAVNSMVGERDFKRTFSLLVEEYQVDQDKAFTITSRVYRGGGFTKDYLYLKGFKEVLKAYNSRESIEHLLCGKVSQEQLPLVEQLIEQGYLVKPKFISPAIRRPASIDPVIRFIAESLL